MPNRPPPGRDAPKPDSAPAADEGRPPDDSDQQVGILPGDIATDNPHDPRFPGSQPDLA